MSLCLTDGKPKWWVSLGGVVKLQPNSAHLFWLCFLLQRVFLKQSTRREKNRNQRKSQKSKMESYVSQTRWNDYVIHSPPPPLSLSFYPSFPLAFYTADGSFTDDSLLQGYGSKQTTSAMFTHWQRRYFKLYPDRLDIGDSFTVRDKDMLSNNNVSISLSVND